MKKITFLILMAFVSFSGFSQWTEGFESGIPATWTVFDNGVGTAQSWGITTTASNVHSGAQAAEILRGNIGAGNTSEDWLVTPLQTSIIANAQLRFFSRSQLTGDNGTLYQIRISSTTASGPNDITSYTVIQQYTELQLSAIANVYEEKIVSLAAYAGQNRYIAFVRVHTQPTATTSGDKWLLDDVKMAQQCFDPTVLSATSITSTTAVLGWTSTATSFDVEYGPQGFTQGTGTTVTGVANPYTATGLTPATPYQFYVRANCGSGPASTSSAWAGPFNFMTKFQGTICSDPYIVTALPYQVTNDTTANYGNNVTSANQGTGCGATPTTTNYLGGSDVVYSFTPTFTGPISITLTPSATSTNSSLFVYNGCANVGVSCIAGLANTGATVRVLNINVTSGQTYIILISSTTATPTIVYNLLIQREECTPSPTALTASGATTTSAILGWTSPTLTTGVVPSTWQVAVQPLGAGIPLGAGTPVTSNPYTAPGLTQATQYQYWVRAECSPGSGVFSAWSGPFAFNTAVCEATSQCNYTFRMSASVSGGWNGARMQVRQNGILVATIGSTFITGLGPIDAVVPLCNGVPFDLYWSVAGTQPQRCKVDVLNSFGQTIYSKAAGTGAVGDILYTEASVNCTTPRCDLPPTALTATLITTTTASLSWTAVATTTWDVK